MADFDHIRTFCLSLPGTSEDIKWGTNLCMLVEKKMFSVIELEPPHEVTFKVPIHLFDEMTAHPEISPAPYLARAHWVMVPHPLFYDRETWAGHLLTSYRLIRDKLPAAIRKELQAADPYP